MHANLKILRKVRKFLRGRATARPHILESLPGGYEMYRLDSNMPKSNIKKAQTAKSQLFVTSTKVTKWQF